MARKLLQYFTLIFIAAVLAVVNASPTRAGSFSVAPLKLVSSPSPFASCAINGTGTNYLNAEVEPWVAANPAKPNNLIAVYQQDRWSDGGARGLSTAYSFDGGQTWGLTFAHFTYCSGGTTANGGDFDRASDPWVTFAPNGDAYQISLGVSTDQLTSAIQVSKSQDGGQTWSEPTTLIRDHSAFYFNDKESITADPGNANFVYAAWDRSRKPGDNASFAALHSYAFRGDPMFARTTNAGATWEAPRRISPNNANIWTIGNQIAVLSDGTLVDIFESAKGPGVQPSPNPFNESLLRSTDKGLTWSRLIDISSDQSVAVLDPDTGVEVRSGAGMPDLGVDPNSGALYVVWSDSRFSGGARDDVALSRSTDGGLTWSAPVKVNQTPAGVAAFTPSVHVAADGTVAVSYYDFRNNDANPGALVDAWLVHCHSASDCTNPANWSEVRLGQSFNIETAPFARGYFLGDYQGLTSIGSTFVPFFIQSNPGSPSNPTDAFVTTVGP